VSLIWLFWRYEDWHNDYYSLTDSQIIDRNSAPLGFAEVKRIGTFEAIQRIRSDVPNVFNTILNMGNVYVDLTGDQEPIKFLSVYKPHEVQQAISRRLDAFRERKRKDESQRLGQELGDWFAVYHDLVP